MQGDEYEIELFPWFVIQKHRQRSHFCCRQESVRMTRTYILMVLNEVRHHTKVPTRKAFLNLIHGSRSSSLYVLIQPPYL